MKFLSKLAEYFAKGLQILGVFQPIVSAVVPGVAAPVQVISKDLTEALQVIVDTEEVGTALQLKGPDKLKAAAPRIADIILQSAALANHKVANPDLFNQGVLKVSDGLADIVNSLHTDGITVTSKKA